VRDAFDQFAAGGLRGIGAVGLVEVEGAEA
jgi:hypothetical protein